MYSHAPSPLVSKVSVSIYGCSSATEMTEPGSETITAVQETDFQKLELSEAPSLAFKQGTELCLKEQYEKIVQKLSEAQSFEGLFKNKKQLTSEAFDRFKDCFIKNHEAAIAIKEFLREIATSRAETNALILVKEEKKITKGLSDIQVMLCAILRCLLDNFPQSAATLNELLRACAGAFNKWFYIIGPKIKGKASAIQNLDEALAYCSFIADFFKGFSSEVSIKDTEGPLSALSCQLEVWYAFEFSDGIKKYFFRECEEEIQALKNKIDNYRVLQQLGTIKAQGKGQSEAFKKNIPDNKEQQAAVQLAARNYLKLFPQTQIENAIDVLMNLGQSINLLCQVYERACKDLGCSKHLDERFQKYISKKFEKNKPSKSIKKTVNQLRNLLIQSKLLELACENLDTAS